MVLVQSAVGGDIKLIQISDSHINAAAGARLRGADVDANLAKVVDHILANHGDAYGIVHTGDLVQDDGPEAYARVREALSRLRRPVWCLPGNHDDPLIMANSLAAGPVSAPAGAVLGHWRLRLLVSPLRNAPGGHLSQNQLVALNRALAQDNQPTLVALHHHPIAVGTPWLDGMMLDNAAALFKVLNKYPHVKAVLFGHIHQAMASELDGIRLLSAPATAFQYRPGTDKPQIDVLPPGYRWLTLKANGTFDTGVVHLH